MRELEPPFQVQYEGVTVSVSEHSVSGTRIFHLVFSDNRKALNITVAEKRPTGEKFWTSVPEGRQTEAEQIGKLIANFIRSKRKG